MLYHACTLNRRQNRHFFILLAATQPLSGIGHTSFGSKQLRDLNAKRQEKLYMDRLDGRITDDKYDKYWQQFRDQIAEADTKISMLQKAEDNY